MLNSACPAKESCGPAVVSRGRCVLAVVVSYALCLSGHVASVFLKAHTASLREKEIEGFQHLRPPALEKCSWIVFDSKLLSICVCFRPV